MKFKIGWRQPSPQFFPRNKLLAIVTQNYEKAHTKVLILLGVGHVFWWDCTERRKHQNPGKLNRQNHQTNVPNILKSSKF